MKIEKGVPAPETSGRDKYPWADMQPGDSFVVSGVSQSALFGSGYGWCQRNRPDLKCATRKEGDGVRVWLVKRDD